MALALLIVGAVAVIAGSAWIFPPAAVVVAGLEAMAGAFVLAWAQDRRPPEGPTG